MSEFPDWFQEIFTLPSLRQVGVLILIAGISWGCRHYLRRFLQSITVKLTPTVVGQQAPWALYGITIIRRSLFALLLWVWLLVAVGIWELFDWERKVLVWLVPIAGIWYGYRLVTAFLTTRLPHDNAIVWIDSVLRPIFLVLILLYGLDFIDDILSFGVKLQDTDITVGTLLTGAIILLLFVFIAQTAKQYLSKTFLPRAGVTPALTQALSAIAAYIIFLIGFLAALDTIGLDLTTLTVIVGGLSVGIGFGLQEIINNFLSGFILLFEQSLAPGDVIQVGDNVGQIEDVGFRSMRIKTIDNVELVVPNSRFLTDVVTNFTRSDLTIRVEISLTVSYDAHPRTVEQALLEAADHPTVLKTPPPEVEFLDFGDNGMLFSLELWTDDPLRLKSFTSKIRFNIWESLERHNIMIPYPQREIHMRTTNVTD